MAYTLPVVNDFKGQFVRDFPYASTLDGVGADGTNTGKVMDSDITSALALAGANFNQGLFVDQPTFSLAFLYLAAHFLVTNLKASSVGVNDQFEWLANSKHVGDVGGSFSIPDRILKSPLLSLYTKTTYGAQYLSIIAPLLQCNVAAFCRQPSPS